MRYFFHLEGEATIYLDHLGKDFAGRDGAARHAANMARELAAEDRWLGWSVRVINTDNIEILHVDIVDALLRD